MMYVHSYQSYLWNHAASLRVQKYGFDQAVIGDLVYCKEESIGKVTGLVASECVDDSLSDAYDCDHLDEIPIADFPEEKSNLVKAVSGEDLLTGNYTVNDVILPLPGSRAIYPMNDIAEVYHNLAKKDGISLTESVHNVKEFSITNMTGAFRRVFQKPMDFEWELLTYTDGNIPLAETDLDTVAKSKPVREGNEDANISLVPTEQTESLEINGKHNNGTECDRELKQAQESQLALKLAFTLPSSCYATMAIRELLKTSTSVAFHKTLND